MYVFDSALADFPKIGLRFLVGEFVAIGVGAGGSFSTGGLVGTAGELRSIPTVGLGVSDGVLVVDKSPVRLLGWVETEGCKETGNLVGLGVGGSEGA